jgi:hypothetical protein
MWEETAVAYFVVLSLNSLGETELQKTCVRKVSLRSET